MDSTPKEGPVNKKAFKYLSDEQIADLPEPEWLIEDVLMKSRLTLLYGPPGGGKTFLALDYCFCVATGRSWQGRPTKQGNVVYVPGEGIGGLSLRVKAWKQNMGHAESAPVFFSTRGIDLLDDDEVDMFIASLRQIRPVLIVIDTLARAMPGGEEDSARDMGLVVKAADKIIAESGAAILFLHHPVKNNAKSERGSGALRGAADTVWRLETRDDSNLTLHCEKQKDSEPSTDIQLRLRVVELDEQNTSCAIEAGSQATVSQLETVDRRALEDLARCPGQQARYRDWQSGSHGIRARTFDRVRQRLLQAGLVERVSASRTPIYRLTPNGITATANLLPEDCHGSALQVTAATATPSIEGAAAVDSGSGLDHLGTTPLDDRPRPKKPTRLRR